MDAVPLAVTVLASIVSGVAIGAVFGFSLASHRDVLAGVRPTHSNRFVRWLARPTRDLNLRDGILYLLVLIVWLVVFFALCAIPVAVAAQFAEPDSLLVKAAVFVFIGVAHFSRQVGANLWKRCIEPAA